MDRGLFELLKGMIAENRDKKVDTDSENMEKVMELILEKIKGPKHLECDCIKCTTVKTLDAYVLDGIKNNSSEYEVLKQRLEDNEIFKKSAKLFAEPALKKAKTNLKDAIDFYVSQKITSEIVKGMEDKKDESSTGDNK